ncbi:bifunctional DNA primase/polymerase [Bradyrhizobium japonicum]|uniref:bifunctional DNA primase/polymerase n=1 Tax=Bradyrhizobium japonicum TaxID=375 RepID=UPI00200D9BDD|nr:bifunctional DNA primase/polymerase [Bradyrhizobium japonicum]UQD70497.1 bifunctional DNA primase/polymerase [Bradyrhizobium japonicum]
MNLATPLDFNCIKRRHFSPEELRRCRALERELERECEAERYNDERAPPPAGAPIVEFAIDYARRGWPVFPCQPRDKSPFFQGGFHRATTDESIIRGWWNYFPRAMIGVPMGERSGVWALDTDPPKKPGEPDGRAVLAQLIERHGELPTTHTETTPRGGQHLLFKWDPTRPVSNSPGALAKTNIDVRGTGGYIVVAPSVCIGDGSASSVAGQYGSVQNVFEFADAPNWLYDLVLTKPGKPAPEAPAPRSSAASGDSEGFWRRVNDLAFQNLGAWVPEIFGHAASFQPGTGAWRISSKNLGRDLEEDLSIHPAGVTDWGVHDMGDSRAGKRTAIDIVIEFGNASDATEAALWLCGRCGIDPANLGWRTNGKAGHSNFKSGGGRYDFNDGLQDGQSTNDNSTGAGLLSAGEADPSAAASSPDVNTATIGIQDFYAYLPRHTYLFGPTGEMWVASSVNARLPKVPIVRQDGSPVLDDNGNAKHHRPSDWLDKHRAVEQLSWAPGRPEVINDHLISEGGWFRRDGCHVFNLYKPPVPIPVSTQAATLWLDHVRKVYPGDWRHIIMWLAHRVQRPHEKTNHALVLGGKQGIGKDTLLEPVKRAVGSWNFIEASPQQVLGRFNGHLRSVILRARLEIWASSTGSSSTTTPRISLRHRQTCCASMKST